jgi:6-pyruvoyltetrahydropterin/6-carboxytetrahydropterin synthase
VKPAVASVTREYGWAMGHRLQHHEGLCRNPHGHNYVAHVTVDTAVERLDREGRPDDGMVLDFSVLDAALRHVLADWDHAFMVENSDPFHEALKAFANVTGEVPKVVVVDCAPTAENIAVMLAEALQQQFRDPFVHVRRVVVYEGPRSAATLEW